MNNFNELGEDLIDFLVFDIDGTLTKGDIVYDAKGIESKTFNVKDGLAIALWNKIQGKQSAFITGRTSPMVQKRAHDLGVHFVFEGIKDKRTCLMELMEQEGLSYSQVAVIGDDLNDYEIMASPALSFCPQDASFYIKQCADVVLESLGGMGAGREMIEYLLKRDPVALKQYLSYYKVHV